MSETISKREFLKTTSKVAIGAFAGAVAMDALTGNKAWAAEFKWPYPWTKIDPELARVKAHTLYWSDKDCCAGVFGGLVECLKPAGEPWTNFPIEIMLFGRGGGNSWGTICGALNGAAAMISLVTTKADSGALINEVWGYGTTENLPTDAANAATYEIIKHSGALAQNIAGSPLCHSSVSQWCMIAGKKVSDVERKERCARLAGDIAAKTAIVLNAHFDSQFTGTFKTPASNAVCLGCHGSASIFNVNTHMECASCHNEAPVHGGMYTSIKPDDENSSDYSLESGYPNPFGSSTSIKFSIPQNEKVRLEIYDIRGILVSSLVDSDYLNRGSYDVKWDGKNNAGEHVDGGVYFARLTTGNFMKSIKLTCVR